MFNYISDMKEPANHYFEGATSVCAKCFGGVGDVLISIGSTAAKYGNITAAVKPSQYELIKHIEGVNEVISVTELNSPEVRSKYDVLINFDFTFNTLKTLKGEDYYTLVARKLGEDTVTPGKLLAQKCQTELIAAIHPSASNPNRLWKDSRWDQVAYHLASCGLDVVWLGTKDEYGFNDYTNGIYCLSDTTEDLLGQVQFLAKCSYFLGVDSGFAHVAGLLGVPGKVLFFNTEARHVIARYSTLFGIDAYKGEVPTRSLDPEDKFSRKYAKDLSVDDVIDELPFQPREERAKLIRLAKKKGRHVVHVSGDGERNNKCIRYLQKYFDLVDGYSDKGVNLIFGLDECVLDSPSCSARVQADEPEKVRYAIREFFAMGDIDG